MLTPGEHTRHETSLPDSSLRAHGERMQTPVLDSFLAHREAGSGSPIVLLHGNPVSSYVWRKVMPLLPGHRVLAPDLIGMGHSGKPELAYTLADHVRYLDAWFDALELREVTVVGYDWGGVLALDWAARHAGRVRAVVVFETILASSRWAEYPPQGAELFRALRTPGVGEKLVLEDNGFLPVSLAHGIRTGLSDADRAEYYAPFPDARSRRPMLAWTRQLPIDDEPAATMEVVNRNNAWLASTKVPATLLTFGVGGLSNAPPVVEQARKTMRVVALPPAGHHAPEDAPEPIAQAILAAAEQRQ